jgi:hypothetical protein
MEACLDIFPPDIDVGANHEAWCHLYSEHADSPKLIQREMVGVR